MNGTAAHQAKIARVDLDRAIGQKEVEPVKNEVKEPFEFRLAPASSHGVNHIDFLRQQHLIHLQENVWFVLQIRVHNSDALSRCERETGGDRTLMAEVPR